MSGTELQDSPACDVNDYAAIGDGRSVALVSRTGVIAWMCWPRFDSEPVFASLLDRRGGAWMIAPTGPFRSSRRYQDDTNVLETRLETASGGITAVELMTIASEEDKRTLLQPEHEVVRHYTCHHGEVELAMWLDLRPNFGLGRARITAHPRLGIRWELGTQLIVLRSDVPVVLDDDWVVHATFRIRAGESVSFSLVFDRDGPAVLPPLGDHVLERISRSVAWWQSWSRRASYQGPDRDAVLRSALAVKLMAYAPSGAIVAAPTTSLPEHIGGEDNWDYRFCWLRDAAFTARALLSLGYHDEAEAFCSWLVHATRLTRPRLRVLYDVHGNLPAEERELSTLEGFCGSRPVRTGNAASDQLQLDVYGEVIDAVARLALVTGALDRDTQGLLRGFGDYVCGHWRLPDHGIWEPRGAPTCHTHSRLLCWVALDRLLELHERGVVARLDRPRYESERAAIREDIESHAFDPDMQCYVSAYGSDEVDANVLLMSWYGFHDAWAPRMRSTFARVRERLEAGPGLLYRYEASRRSREGAFWICSFWAVEHLAMGGGTAAEARTMFDDARRYANDVGLMSEEVDPIMGTAIGNFPQAYTHVGLISAALTLAERSREGAA